VALAGAPLRLNVDREADAPYLRLGDSKIVESGELSPGIVLDFNEANEVVGSEMLHLSKRSKAPAMDFVQLEGVPTA
jgi:uncharacterized protein YuzE